MFKWEINNFIELILYVCCLVISEFRDQGKYRSKVSQNLGGLAFSYINISFPQSRKKCTRGSKNIAGKIPWRISQTIRMKFHEILLF